MILQGAPEPGRRLQLKGTTLLTTWGSAGFGATEPRLSAPETVASTASPAARGRSRSTWTVVRLEWSGCDSIIRCAAWPPSVRETLTYQCEPLTRSGSAHRTPSGTRSLHRPGGVIRRPGPAMSQRVARCPAATVGLSRTTCARVISGEPSASVNPAIAETKRRDMGNSRRFQTARENWHALDDAAPSVRGAFRKVARAV
jgi:hypothetical protein